MAYFKIPRLKFKIRNNHSYSQLYQANKGNGGGGNSNPNNRTADDEITTTNSK